MEVIKAKPVYPQFSQRNQWVTTWLHLNWPNITLDQSIHLPGQFLFVVSPFLGLECKSVQVRDIAFNWTIIILSSSYEDQ